MPSLVTLICVFGILPYISLQLKSISDTFRVVTKTQYHSNIFDDTTTYVCIALAIFASYYGTRYVDASEKRKGIVTAVAVESLLKLAHVLNRINDFEYIFKPLDNLKEIEKLFSDKTRS